MCKPMLWCFTSDTSEVQGEGVRRVWTNPPSNDDLIIASYLGSLNTKLFQV